MTPNTIRSFASGIIFATAIFTAIYFVQPTSGDEAAIVEDDVITEEDVQHFLHQNGQVSIPKETYEELTKLESAAKQDEASNEQVVENEGEASNQSTTNAAIQHQEVNETTDTTEITEEPSKTYSLKITPGMSGLQIGRKLESAQIVASGREFSRFLAAKKWQSKIQVGTYHVSSDMTYEQIGKIIITKQP